ncbi:4Fe-4S dicluster domain-containing protein [Anaeromyxobacter oryzisoli]|uniref:4Fe-4S dicluster domain-containing protein n=1 Tax=Anaeromyxobacter oryzisoli TaxID=2925408 RepID=UPI001F563B14|nr:4Fe-4S dicluster domain-containing protein [Anaeromyxobacter sp. SG63]
MCTFCVKHGEGKRWYLNAENYAADLESDLRRRGFMVDFVGQFERHRRGIEVGLRALRLAPEPLRAGLARSISERQQREHFGQPVPIEQCERIFAIATNITRVPCVCRGAQKKGSDAESCCLVATVTPHDGVLADVFAGYEPGPHAEGFEKLTPERAVAYLRRCEEGGLAHTVWTFGTPFIAAICNCDLPSGCMAMRVQLQGKVRVMWRGEDVARLDPERCSGCAACVPLCPFGALGKTGPRAIALDRTACWGCGTCRAGCARGALTLEERARAPDVARIW